MHTYVDTIKLHASAESCQATRRRRRDAFGYKEFWRLQITDANFIVFHVICEYFYVLYVCVCMYACVCLSLFMCLHKH